jgi:hypothetical protein
VERAGIREAGRRRGLLYGPRTGAHEVDGELANSSLHLTGSCGTVFVNGAGSDVEVDSAERILVNGAHATVTYHGTSKVLVDGADATAHQA